MTKRVEILELAHWAWLFPLPQAVSSHFMWALTTSLIIVLGLRQDSARSRVWLMTWGCVRDKGKLLALI